jgi:hypothetical protein
MDGRAALAMTGGAAMSSSGGVKLRYERCLQVWGNATDFIGATPGVINHASNRL